LMVATSLGAYVADLRTRVSDLEATIELLTSSLGVLVHDGGWPERPVDDRPYAWIGPAAPPVTDGALGFNTAPRPGPAGRTRAARAGGCRSRAGRPSGPRPPGTRAPAARPPGAGTQSCGVCARRA